MLKYSVWLPTKLGERNDFHFCDSALRANHKWWRADCCILSLPWKYLAPPNFCEYHRKQQRQWPDCVYFYGLVFQLKLSAVFQKTNLLEVFPQNKNIKCKNSVTQWSGHILFLCSKQEILFLGNAILLSTGA